MIVRDQFYNPIKFHMQAIVLSSITRWSVEFIIFLQLQQTQKLIQNSNGTNIHLFFVPILLQIRQTSVRTFRSIIFICMSV